MILFGQKAMTDHDRHSTGAAGAGANPRSSVARLVWRTLFAVVGVAMLIPGGLFLWSGLQ